MQNDDLILWDFSNLTELFIILLNLNLFYEVVENLILFTKFSKVI